MGKERKSGIDKTTTYESKQNNSNPTNGKTIQFSSINAESFMQHQ